MIALDLCCQINLLESDHVLAFIDGVGPVLKMRPMAQGVAPNVEPANKKRPRLLRSLMQRMRIPLPHCHPSFRPILLARRKNNKGINGSEA